MPYSPKAAAVNIEMKRSTRNDRPIPYCGTVNEASATMLTTMTMMELTIFASTPGDDDSAHQSDRLVAGWEASSPLLSAARS